MVELARRPHRLIGMEYCLGDGDGSATIWSAAPDIDLNGDGAFDAVGLDYDADGLLDDAMADLDANGVADHMVRDHLSEAAYFTDDGTGTWAVSLDREGVGPHLLGDVGLGSTASSMPGVPSSMLMRTVRPTTDFWIPTATGLPIAR